MLGVDDKQAQTARARAPPECAPSPPLRVRPTRRARDVALRTIHRQYDDPFRVRRLGYNPFDDDDDVVARGMADSARERRRTLGSGDARWLSIGGGDDDSLSSSDGEYVENELENRQRAGSEDDDGAKDDNMDMGNRTPVMTRQDHVQALRVEAAVVDELPASLTAIVAPIPRSAEPLSFDFDHDWQPQNLGVTTVDRTVDGSVNTHPRDEEPLVRPSTPELASVRQRKIAETIRKLFGIRGISTVPDTANATRKRKRRTAAARSRRLRKVQMPGHGGGSLMVRGDNALSDAEVEARMRRKRVKRDRVVAEGARQPHALVVLSDDEEMTRKRRHGTARRALRVVSDDEHARRNSTIRRSAIPNSRQKTPSRHRAEATSAASFESPAVATTASRRPRKTATERRAEAQIKVDAFVDAFLQTNSEPFDTTVHERPDFLRLAERQFRSWRSGGILWSVYVIFLSICIDIRLYHLPGNPTKALQQLRRKEIRIYDDIKDHVEQETRDRLLCTYYKDIKPVKRRRRKPAAITSAARQQKQAIPVDSEEEEEDEPYLETSHRIPDSPPIRRSRKPLEAIISTKRFRRKSVRRASSSKLHPPPSASRRHNGVPPLLPTTSRPLPSSDVFEADDDYQQMADFERETSATTAFDLLMSASRTHIATPRRRKEKQLRPKKRQSIVPASFTPGRHGDVPLSALPTFRAPWEQRFATSSTHAVLTSFATIHDIDAVGTFNPVPATLLPGLLPVVPSDKAYMDTSTVHANFQSLWQLCTCTVQFEHVEKQSAGNRVMFQQWRRLRLFIDQCCALVPSTLPDGVVEELAFVSAGMEALLTKGSVPSVPTTSSTLMKSPRSLGLRLALRLFDAILSRSSGDNSNDKFSALLADFLDVTLHLMVTYPLNEIPPDYQSLYCGHTTEELWRTMCELWVRVPSDATSGATDILAKTIASFVERESTTESSSTMQIVTTVLRTVQLLATLLPSADLDLWSIVSWCIDYATNKQRKPVSSTQAQQLLAFCVDFVMAFGKQRPMQDKGLKILANLGALDMSFKESSATADSKLTVVSGDVRIRPLVDFQLRTTDGRYVLSAFGEGHRLFDLVAFYFQEECGSVCTIRLSSSGASYVPPTDPAIARPQLSLFKKLTSQLLLAQLPSRPSALAIGSSTTDLHKLLQLLLLYTLAAPLQQKASFALYIDRILDFEKSTNAEARLYVLQAALFQIKVLLDFRETPTKMIESFFEKFQSVTGEYQLEELRRGQPVLFRNSDRVGTSGSTNGAAALGGFRSDLEYQQWHRAQAQRATCIERILLDMRVVIEGMGFQEDGFLLARSGMSCRCY